MSKTVRLILYIVSFGVILLQVLPYVVASTYTLLNE